MASIVDRYKRKYYDRFEKVISEKEKINIICTKCNNIIDVTDIIKHNVYDKLRDLYFDNIVSCEICSTRIIISFIPFDKDNLTFDGGININDLQLKDFFKCSQAYRFL